MIYLDTCILIYLVQGHPDYRPEIERAIERQPRERLAISPLVHMECLVRPFQLSDVALEAGCRRVFASCVNLPMPPEAFEDAARLRATYSLKTPDALHLAVARRTRCSALWTNDNRLACAAPDYAVNICRPPAQG